MLLKTETPRTLQRGILGIIPGFLNISEVLIQMVPFLHVQIPNFHSNPPNGLQTRSSRFSQPACGAMLFLGLRATMSLIDPYIKRRGSVGSRYRDLEGLHSPELTCMPKDSVPAKSVLVGYVSLVWQVVNLPSLRPLRAHDTGIPSKIFWDEHWLAPPFSA